MSGIAGGFTVGLGRKAGVAIGVGEYDDHKSDLDPYKFDGEAKLASAGAGISLIGVGASALQLGEARIPSAGWQPGFDFRRSWDFNGRKRY